jgi:hypothetical protein
MVASLAEARSHNVQPEVFLRHYRDIRKAKAAHADTGMEIARLKKSAKSAGIDLDALKMLEKFADLDEQEAEMQLSHLMVYAQWIELPLHTQLNMFKAPVLPVPHPESAREHHDFLASEAGMKAGKTGDMRTANAYAAGTSEYVAWDKAWTKGNKVWLKGQAKIAGRMGRNGAAARGNGAAE